MSNTEETGSRRDRTGENIDEKRSAELHKRDEQRCARTDATATPVAPITPPPEAVFISIRLEGTGHSPQNGHDSRGLCKK